MMKVKRMLSVGFLLFVMQATAFAMSGQQVYDKYKQTEKKMEKSIRSMIMVMEMTGPGMAMETTIYTKGDKMRVESLIRKSPNPMMGKPGQKTIVIDDGVKSTVFSPMMGKMESPSDRSEEEDRKPQSVKLLGTETVSGIKCYKIRAGYPDGETETLWISASDYVLVKESDSEGSTTINSNFKKIKGFSLPHLMQTYEGSTLESTSKVKSVKVDVKISDSRFDPSKVKGFSTAKEGVSSSPAGTDEASKAMNMMEMVMEIQRLYQNGEVEKAKALEKKMQKMMGQ